MLQIESLLNPTEECLDSNADNSLHLRFYEDDQLEFKIAENVDGLEPSLNCLSNCASCELVDRSKCTSCYSGSILDEASRACLLGEECPVGSHKVQ